MRVDENSGRETEAQRLQNNVIILQTPQENYIGRNIGDEKIIQIYLYIIRKNETHKREVKKSRLIQRYKVRVIK